MKKLFALIAISLLAISAASAATLNLTGSVTANVTATMVSGKDTIALTFDGAGAVATADQSAQLKVISNKKNWTISFSSLNDGELINGQTGDAASSIPYKLQAAIDTTKFGSSAAFDNDLASAAQLTSTSADTQIVATVDARSLPAGGIITISASVEAQNATDLLWDSKYAYTDTVTISIAAN